jgi:hypothetical protein
MPDARGTRPLGMARRRRRAGEGLVTGLCGLVVDSCRGVGDGALCNDQNTCTVGDKCAGGVCVGTLALDGTSCTDNNQCTATDVCVQGVCKGTAVAEGTLCTDGEPCTDPDTCKLGQCTPGGPATCDDGDQCTMDHCLEGEGCRHDPILTCPDASPPGDGAAGDAADAGDGTSSDGAAPDGAIPDAAEARPDADAGAADAADASDDGTPADVPVVDASEDGDAAADGPDDADALSDGGGEGGDGGGGGDGGALDIARIYEAQGGACVCSSAPEGSRPSVVLTVALALTLLQARRGRGRPTGDHPSLRRAPGSSVPSKDR